MGGLAVTAPRQGGGAEGNAGDGVRASCQPRFPRWGRSRATPDGPASGGAGTVSRGAELSTTAAPGGVLKGGGGRRSGDGVCDSEKSIVTLLTRGEGAPHTLSVGCNRRPAELLSPCEGRSREGGGCGGNRHDSRQEAAANWRPSPRPRDTRYANPIAGSAVATAESTGGRGMSTSSCVAARC